jgi:hypothetical protein
MHTHKQAYIQTYITFHYITLHYLTLNYIHYITIHYITLHYNTLHYITYIHYIDHILYCSCYVHWFVSFHQQMEGDSVDIGAHEMDL